MVATCAELAAHPAVIASRDYWLENVTSATMRLADDRVTERPRARDTTRVSSSLTTDQTAEVDDARRRSTRTMDAILLGALSRTLAQVIGEGVVAVDLDGAGRSVLKPDVDLRRSVGWFTTIYPVPLTCATERAHRCNRTAGQRPRRPSRRCPTTASATGCSGTCLRRPRGIWQEPAHRTSISPTSVRFRCRWPEMGRSTSTQRSICPCGKRFRASAMPSKFGCTASPAALHFDWWYDARRVERATVEALAQHYPVALTELTRQASESISADNRAAGALSALTLVDLSATDTG